MKYHKLGKLRIHCVLNKHLLMAYEQSLLYINKTIENVSLLSFTYTVKKKTKNMWVCYQEEVGVVLLPLHHAQ